MVSLLGIEFGDGACHTAGFHPGAGGSLWHLKKRGSAFNKFDLPKQRVALLSELLQRFPRSLLRWKGTPTVSGDLSEMVTRASDTWEIPAKAPADRVHALVAPGEWLIYATRSGSPVEDDRLDVWNERKGLFVLSSRPEFFIGARVGDDPWIFWIRPGL